MTNSLRGSMLQMNSMSNSNDKKKKKKKTFQIFLIEKLFLFATLALKIMIIT